MPQSNHQVLGLASDSGQKKTLKVDQMLSKQYLEKEGLPATVNHGCDLWTAHTLHWHLSLNNNACFTGEILIELIN